MKRLVVFSDLDGTLLDHDTYDWQSAAPAVLALRQRGVPLVLVSSKTLAEMEVMQQALKNNAPLVAENGCFIKVPEGYFADDTGSDDWPEPVSRERLQRSFEEIRALGNFDCVAFYEMRATGIAAATGLTAEAAERANQRAASEPILWQDSADRLAAFSEAAAERGLRTVRGGRFVHLMGQADKAQAVQALMRRYHGRWPDDELVSVALGDGPNDLDMLRAADIAVVIRGRHAHAMPLTGHAHVLRPPLPGPDGWAQAIAQVLELYSPTS